MGKIIGVSNFRDSAVWWIIKQAEGNWQGCKCLQMVSIYKFWVYKTISKPKVNENLEWNFIKMILTKDQGRSKRDKEWIGIRKSRCVESDGTYCCTGKFNVGSSMWPSVCVESWGLLSIFSRVSQKWLLEYQQSLKHCGLWEWPWSASWDRSPTCSLLLCNRDIDCFWDVFCIYY